ncbi:MAG: 50S ribosomal protein L31 [Acidobacteria bacterium]|nr:50S ribosomal protein L31 [Acidobacteriota bacterium]
MKEGIHPKYVECKVHCACGNEFTTRSSKNEIQVEICSACHPFFTGKQKLIDTAGRVERYKRRYAMKTPTPAPAPTSPDA